MYRASKKQSFIEGIRALDESLSNIKLNEVQVDREQKLVFYLFVTNKVVSEDAKNKLSAYLLENSDQAFLKVGFDIKKAVADAETVAINVFYYLKNNCPSITLKLKREDVLVFFNENVNKFCINVTPSMRAYLETNGTVKALTDYINRSYCENFVCELIDIPDTPVGEYKSTVKSEERNVETERIIKVTNMFLIDERYMPTIATYIEDATDVGNYVLCGKIVSIVEKMTKTQKPYFIFRIDDGTGERSGIYFSKESTLSLIKQLKEGNEIIAKVRLEFRDGKIDCRFEKINGCKILPYEKVALPSKKVPEEYQVVFPEPFQDNNTLSMFEKEDDLSLFKGKNIVVFDTETTGISSTTCTVIEIGAYKLKDGKITERFATLIDPMMPLSEEITKLTGITDYDLKGKPKIYEVVPDFIKFIDGALLVGQNVQFDMSFMRAMSTPLGYTIENPTMDTLLLARQLLPNKKDYKLETIAKHFNIEFNAHRAYDDALATAKIFIKLVNMKGVL